MRRARRIAALALVPLAVVGIAVFATGVLYLLRGHVTALGPGVRDALPLDELPRHDAVPLSLLVAVWAVAALLLGALVRALRLERLKAAILLALCVGLWTYLETGVSLLVVRQVPAAVAFGAAGRLSAVYLPALLAGLGGALLGRSKDPHPRRRRSTMRRTAYAGVALAVAIVTLGAVITAASVQAAPVPSPAGPTHV